MGLYQTTKLLHSKRNQQQNKKATNWMGDDICKQQLCDLIDQCHPNNLIKNWKKEIEDKLVHTWREQKYKHWPSRCVIAWHVTPKNEIYNNKHWKLNGWVIQLIMYSWEQIREKNPRRNKLPRAHFMERQMKCVTGCEQPWRCKFQKGIKDNKCV